MSKAAQDLVILETMPDHLRASHRAARNWGTYPHNGATRLVCDREVAEQQAAEDADGYDSIVRDADESDLAEYDHHGLLALPPRSAPRDREGGFPGHDEDA